MTHPNEDETLDHRPAPGELAGRRVGSWRLERLLGRGGMASVWLARHAFLGARAAVKVLQPELADDASHARRFEEEARTGARLHHPNLVQVFDYLAPPDGPPCIVMEFVEGPTLDQAAGRSPMAPARAHALLCQVAAAIAEVHYHGVVHRDVKPQNVLVVRGRDGEETAKVVDFGIAKGSLAESGPTLPGTTMGTPQYMSPEQAMGEAVDFRSDVYALGALGFRLLAGHAPFQGSLAEILAQHVRATPPKLTNGSEELKAIIARALSKRPADRFDTAGELLRALRAATPANEAKAERSMQAQVERGRVLLRFDSRARMHDAFGGEAGRRRIFVAARERPVSAIIDLAAEAPGADPIIARGQITATFDEVEAPRLGLPAGFLVELQDPSPKPVAAPVAVRPPASPIEAIAAPTVARPSTPVVVAGARRPRADRFRRRFMVSFGPVEAPSRTGFTTNISGTGLALVTPHPQAKGARVFLSFTSIPDRPRVQGQVVWSRAPAMRGLNGMMGVRVEGADEAYFRLLVEIARGGEVAAPAASKPRGQVMLVEDSRDVRSLLAEAFTAEGYEVLECADGGLALAAMDRLQPPCAVVLDLAMPLVDGWRVLDAMRASPTHRDLPVLVLSAHPDAALARAARHVAKPFELENVLRTVRELVAATSVTRVH